VAASVPKPITPEKLEAVLAGLPVPAAPTHVPVLAEPAGVYETPAPALIELKPEADDPQMARQLVMELSARWLQAEAHMRSHRPEAALPLFAELIARVRHLVVTPPHDLLALQAAWWQADADSFTVQKAQAYLSRLVLQLKASAGKPDKKA